jgi:hypothetical protein
MLLSCLTSLTLTLTLTHPFPNPYLDTLNLALALTLTLSFIHTHKGGVKCDGEKTAKALYLSIMFFSTILAAVMRYNGSSIVGDLSEITGACNGNSLDSVQDNSSSSCEGNQAVYVFVIDFVVVLFCLALSQNV